MVKKLRNQFVIVTTSLMVIVLGSFLLINTLYNHYWNSVEIIDMLDWIADREIFRLSQDDIADYMVEEFDERENSIIGVVLDKEYKTVDKYVLGKGEDFNIRDNILKKMCEKRETTNKVGKYYFSYSEPDEDHILLVVMDSTVNEKLILRVLGGIVLTIVGIFLLILITMFLSRFITEPAKQSLLREKRFISDASHELKTPLGAISINAQALEIENKDNLYLKNIISESKRMSRLIENLLTLSKLDEDETKELYSISLSDICEEMVLTYESLAFEKHIEFTYMIDENITICGNDDEIRQLFAILIDNALKNVNDVGKVSVKCIKESNKAVVKVSNTGHGIAPEDLEHVFERFYTTDKARNNGSFGLGLSIAKAIVERHGGCINVTSEIDKQTEFSIYF